MKEFKSKEEAFASQNYDPAAVVISGVPERHVAALKAVANLFVAHDAVNPDFQPDFSDYDQDKWEAWFQDFDPSGAGFSFSVDVIWRTISSVGARLVAESPKAVRHIAELFEDDWKAMMVYERPINNKKTDENEKV